MFCVDTYMSAIIKSLQDAFGDRLLYVGLQGSYLRGEATEQSDIDVVTIIDDLSAQDLSLYKVVISELDCPEKSCGFVCGREEIQKWNPMEICNFLYGTKDYYGRLSDYLPEYSSEDVVNFIKMSAGNLYHEITHRYLHADLTINKSKLPFSYKNVFFVLQSVYYLRTGIFHPTKKELMKYLSENDREVMTKAMRLMEAEDYNFDEEFKFLFEWCQKILRSFDHGWDELSGIR